MFALQYFSETAHNPETNQRPGRLKTAMTSGSELRFHRGRDSSPIYQSVWEHHRGGGGGGSAVKASAAARFVSPHRTPSTRRSSACTETNGGGSYAHHRNKPSPSVSNLNSRHSMDVGVACRDGLLQAAAAAAADQASSHYHHHQHQQQQQQHHHHHHHHQQALHRHQHHGQTPAPDDSVIMSRIKKSLEQKEEFLRRPVPSQQPQHPTKEFYSRPQKLSTPVWPPPPSVTQPQSAESCSALQDSTSPPPPPPAASKPKSKQFVNTLGKIHEDGGGKSATAKSAPAAETEHLPKQTNMQVVSMRAKQFESGRMDDKTDFYKSELSRLSSKHNVPNVAVRKMEYEQKLYSDKVQPSATLQHQESRDESFTSCSSEYYTVLEIW